MDESRSNPAVWIAALLLPAFLYLGSYLALVEAESPGRVNGRPPFPKDDVYRFGGSVADFVFMPVNAVDRKLRRGYWEIEGPQP